MDIIQGVCPLNRDVRVGCLYDYINAKILPEFLEVVNEDIEYTSCSPLEVISLTITTDDSERARLYYFGIDHHLSQQLDAKKFKMNRLWFYNHLKDEAFGNCNSDNEFQIIAYLRFIRRVETLEGEFVGSNLWSYCDDSHSGTHLVEEVQYGAEFVLRLRKTLDPSKEKKQALEQIMRLALNNYLEHLFDGISSPPTLNEMLETMNCSFQSSIGNGLMYSGSFESCLRKIQEMTNIKKNDRRNVWRPVSMQLCRIPTKMEIRVAKDLCKDTPFHFKDMHQRITQQCRYMIELPSLHRVTFLKKSLLGFQKLLKPIESASKRKLDSLQGTQLLPKEYEFFTDPYGNLLKRACNWLKQFYKDVEKVAYVLEGNNLQVLDLRSINKPIKEVRNVKRTHVFVLHFTCITTDLDKRFEMWASNPEKDLHVFTFEISDRPVKRWVNICKEWQGFLNEAIHSTSNDVDYAVGILSPNSPYEEGMVVTIGHEEILRACYSTPSYGNCLPNFPYWEPAEVPKRLRQD